MFTRSTAASVVLLSVLAPLATAQTGWDETTQGDLSSDRFNPTQVPLAFGSNRVIGNTQETDRDFLTITLAPGQQLGSLFLENYVGEDGASFIGMQAGSFLTVDPDDAAPSDLLGWALFGPSHNNVGLDILPEMGDNFGIVGFVPPLPSGTYTFWIQQLGPPTDYTFNFVVVPAPSGAAVLAGMSALAMIRRRR
jgi:hypothetical protein